jgi:hypothetical protein
MGKIPLPPPSEWTLDADQETVGGIGIRTKDKYEDKLLSIPSLIHRWPMDGNWTDPVGGNDGTPVGGATFNSTGQRFGAYCGLFPTSSNYINIPNKLYVSSDQKWTLLYWFRCFELAGASIYQIGMPAFSQGNAVSQHCHIGVLDGKNVFEWFFAGSNKIQGTAIVADGNLHMAAYTGAIGGAVRILTDGVFENSGIMTHNSTVSTRIAENYQGDSQVKNWNGILDEMAFFNDTLSDAQILDLYKAYSSSGPVARSPWIAIDQNTLDATTAITIIENAIAILQGKSTGTNLFQYALNNGTFNGIWLTLAQLNAALVGQTIIDKQNSLRLEVKMNSDGFQANDISGFGSEIQASGLSLLTANYELPEEVIVKDDEILIIEGCE